MLKRKELALSSDEISKYFELKKNVKIKYTILRAVWPPPSLPPRKTHPIFSQEKKEAKLAEKKQLFDQEYEKGIQCNVFKHSVFRL